MLKSQVLPALGVLNSSLFLSSPSRLKYHHFTSSLAFYKEEKLMNSDILDTFQITEVIIFIDVQVPSLWLLSSPPSKSPVSF